nr:hypothetical protein CFP56_57044 [Quercus suber]
MIRRLHVLMLPSPPGGYACMTTGNRCESPLLVAYAGVCESTILHEIGFQMAFAVSWRAVSPELDAIPLLCDVCTSCPPPRRSPMALNSQTEVLLSPSKIRASPVCTVLPL